MKLLVLGWYYAANLGDAVICDCVAAKLRECFPKSEVTICDLDGRSQFTDARTVSFSQLRRSQLRNALREGLTRSGLHDFVYSYYEKGFRSHLNAVERAYSEDAGKADAVVIAGGQMYMDYLTPQVTEWVDRFADRGVPIFFNACGTGPAMSRRFREQYRRSLMRPEVKWISARDHADFVESYYLDGEKPVTPVSDPALWADEVYGASVEKAGAPFSGGGKPIGLGVMYARNLPVRRCIRFWQDLIRYLDAQRIRWEIFVNGDSRDEQIGKAVLQGMPEYKMSIKEHMAAVPHTPRQLVETIASYRGMISFRLHSHIIACSLGIPTAAIVWDDKINDFYRSIDHPERCCSIEDSPEKVWNTWQQAEQEGYPAEKISRMRQKSLDLLTEQIKTVV